MTDKDIDEAIETLVRACNVERRQAVTQALRRMVNSGGEPMSDDEIDLLADQHHIFGKVNRLRSFARSIESRVLAERKEPRLWVMFGENGRVLAYSSVEPTNSGFTYTPLFAHPTPDDASQWIDVKDRLPPVGRNVLCYVPESHNPLVRVKALARFQRYEGAVDYYWDNHYPGRGNMHIATSVSHWRELPNGPDAAIDRARQSGEEGRS